MTHFWFMGKEVMAYNDQIAISVPFKTDFKCAVPGRMMLDMVASMGSDPEMTLDGDALILKAGKTKVDLPTMGKEAFIFDPWDMEKEPDEIELGDGYLDKAGTPLVNGIKDCLNSVGENVAQPDQLGVRFVMDGESLRLYSTNSSTLSRVILPAISKKMKARHITMPTAFCRQLVALTDDLSKAKLIIAQTFMIAELKDGVTLFGRCVGIPNPIDFDDIFKRHASMENFDKKSIEMPNLEAALTRAVLITDSPTEPTRTHIAVKDGVMSLDSESNYGEVHDRIAVPKHPEVELKVMPKHFKVGFDNKFDRLLMTSDCIIMTRRNATFLVATNE